MRKVILFIATSLDGYVARRDGSIDWLYTEGDFGYQEFLASIDTTLMGGVTYREVLGFGEFPYKDGSIKNYVFTRRPESMPGEYVEFVSSDIPEFVRALKQQPGKNIWLMGGGQINTVLLNAGLVDEMRIFLHPVILGDGIPVFAPPVRESWFTVEDAHVHERGLTELRLRANSNHPAG